MEASQPVLSKTEDLGDDGRSPRTSESSCVVSTRNVSSATRPGSKPAVSSN